MDLCLAVRCQNFIFPPPLWPSIMSKVDAALSSLSGAVGGPVRLNGQSMKALLEFFDGKNALSHCTVGLFKTILQIEAAQDLFQAFIVHCYGSFL